MADRDSRRDHLHGTRSYDPVTDRIRTWDSEKLKWVEEQQPDQGSKYKTSGLLAMSDQPLAHGTRSYDPSTKTERLWNAALTQWLTPDEWAKSQEQKLTAPDKTTHRYRLTAPRVTPQRIEEVIAAEYYFTAADGAEASTLTEPNQIHNLNPLKLLTFCVLVLRNGFTVTGESACASPENFNAELGRKIARQNAVNKIWPLEGYLLRQKLDAIQQGRFNEEQAKELLKGY